MPLGAAQTASAEDKMKSERNKESGENLYSTGFVAFANGLPASGSAQF
jgi:hypothetical protein